MKDIIGSVICVITLTIAAVLEKFVVERHDHVHFSFARLFYMLLIALVVMIVVEPNVVSTSAFRASMIDINLIIVSLTTSIGLLIYYWLLKSNDLYIVSLVWPVTMVLSVIGGYIFLKETLTWLQWIGILVTFVGLTMILIYKKN